LPQLFAKTSHCEPLCDLCNTNGRTSSFLSRIFPAHVLSPRRGTMFIDRTASKRFLLAPAEAKPQARITYRCRKTLSSAGARVVFVTVSINIWLRWSQSLTCLWPRPQCVLCVSVVSVIRPFLPQRHRAALAATKRSTGSVNPPPPRGAISLAPWLKPGDHESSNHPQNRFNGFS